MNRLVICIGVLIVVAVICITNRKVDDAVKPVVLPSIPSQFIEIGEVKYIGAVELHVFQNRETGKRYILADRRNGGVFIQPID